MCLIDVNPKQLNISIARKFVQVYIVDGNLLYHQRVPQRGDGVDGGERPAKSQPETFQEEKTKAGSLAGSSTSDKEEKKKTGVYSE